MARLRRKKPTSAKKKKKKQEDASSLNSYKPSLREKASGTAVARKLSTGDQQTLPRREAPKAMRLSGRSFQPAFVTKTTQFLREVKIELKKVTWPSRKETLASTGVVLVIVVIISAFLGLVDMGLSSLIRLVLG